MYRIELSPGEETAFRSIEELAVAIRRGVVTSKARIWHNASAKWLPIQFHPHYKTASEMPLTQADLVVGPPVAPLSALSIPDPSAPPRVTPFRPVAPTPKPAPAAATSRVTPFKPASPYHQPEPSRAADDQPLIEPLGSMSAPAPVNPDPIQPERARTVAFRPLPQPPAATRPAASRDESPRKKKKATRKSSRRGLRVALVGALLIGGAHLLISVGTALRQDGLRTSRRLVAASPEVIKRDSPRTVAAVIPSLRNSSVPAPPASTLGSLIPTVAPGVTLPDSGEIQAAPTVEIPVPAPAAADSLTPTVTDSSGKKVLKGILRAVSGTAPSSQKGPAKPKR